MNVTKHDDSVMELGNERPMTAVELIDEARMAFEGVAEFKSLASEDDIIRIIDEVRVERRRYQRWGLS